MLYSLVRTPNPCLTVTSKHVMYIREQLDCRAGQSDGYCVPQSMQQNAPSCSADGHVSQCASNSLCFMRDSEDDSLEKWYVFHCPLSISVFWTDTAASTMFTEREVQC